jgi:hypothetical protein
MATPATDTTLSTYYVGWSEDQRNYQLLGLYEAAGNKDAVQQASINHGKAGRYLVLASDKVTLFDVTFDMVPQMTKVEEDGSVPPPEPPPVA